MPTSTTPCALIVDDDAITLMDLEGTLTDTGFHCFQVDEGDAARRMLPEHTERITLRWTDVEMPRDTDGLALARHLSETYPWIAIVIASGRIKPAPRDLPEGATFLSKPFNARAVRSHLQQILPDGKKPKPLTLAM
jgi:DNA-binding NtrC family response regulator